MAAEQPPRPFSVGDVVAVYSEALGAWTASQITGIDVAGKSAAVVELDWSGPEPASVADLGDVQPLRLTHHSWDGKLALANRDWVLPRSFTVIGARPPLATEPTSTYSGYWGRGEQLAMQRQWDGGDHGDWEAPYDLTCTADELAARPGVTHLTVRDISELDCARLVADFPELTRLWLSGDLGTLTSAAALNQLPRLQALTIYHLFGMEASDCLLPRHVPDLEELTLGDVPAAYATATREAWRPEVRHGVQLDVRGARKPDWVAVNANNPLRDWDGRDHIPRAAYRKAIAQYKATREAVLGAAPDHTEIGRAFGEAFNALDSGFIETAEREELFDALDALMDEARAGAEARAALIEGVEAVRDW